MPTTISKTSALLALARMMGKRTIPQGVTSDWEDYIQFAFDYAWRYYKWSFSLKSASVATVMPDDFDIDGYRFAIPNANGNVTEMSLIDFKTSGQNMNSFALEWDMTAGRYNILLGSQAAGGITIVYQVAPPTLSETGVPFPSAMTIGIGASIYAKQGENPTRADITQEWDEFHKELDRHVAHAERNKPRQYNINIQDFNGTYTGDVRN